MGAHGGSIGAKLSPAAKFDGGAEFEPSSGRQLDAELTPVRVLSMSPLWLGPSG